MNNTLHPDISNTCTQADKLLWDAYAHSVGDQTDISREGRLVFPLYRNKESLRVSEQEARFAFIVEAPGLTLHICVLRQRFSLQKDVPLDLTETELTNYLHVDLQVSQAELTEVKDLNGWKLEQHSKQ